MSVFVWTINQKYLKKVPDTVTIGSKLNFSTQRSAAVIESLLHDADLQKVREVNKTKAGKGKDALKVWMKIAENKRDEEKQVQQKKDEKNNERKRKFDELQNMIQKKYMPLEKLSLSQLKTLCSFKKRNTDKISISKLKQNELLPLWLSWKDRQNVWTMNMLKLPKSC